MRISCRPLGRAQINRRFLIGSIGGGPPEWSLVPVQLGGGMHGLGSKAEMPYRQSAKRTSTASWRVAATEAAFPNVATTAASSAPVGTVSVVAEVDAPACAHVTRMCIGV
jgi:hypothetical protein